LTAVNTPLRRTKSRFFNKDKARDPATLASVAAFTAWRLGLATIKQMRSAQFEIEANAQYFEVLREYLVFLIQVADRLALARLSLPERRQFTVSMVKRLAELLAENQSRLLGGAEADIRGAFIELFNARADDYAQADFGQGVGQDVAFMRLASVALLAAVAPQDRAWVADQVMTYEAPSAVATLRRVIDNVVGTSGAIVAAPDDEAVDGPLPEMPGVDAPVDDPIPPE
jgi:hypothetical protein